MSEPKSLSERLRLLNPWIDIGWPEIVQAGAAELDAKDARIAELTALVAEIKAAHGESIRRGNRAEARIAEHYSRIQRLEGVLRQARVALLPLSDEPDGAPVFKRHRAKAARVMDEIDAALHQENKDGK